MICMHRPAGALTPIDLLHILHQSKIFPRPLIITQRKAQSSGNRLLSRPLTYSIYVLSFRSAASCCKPKYFLFSTLWYSGQTKKKKQWCYCSGVCFSRLRGLSFLSVSSLRPVVSAAALYIKLYSQTNATPTVDAFVHFNWQLSLSGGKKCSQLLTTAASPPVNTSAGSAFTFL